MTKEEAFEKLKRYCDYQDRCHKEVRSKLLSLKIYGDWLEEIMSDLISDGYLNEERFARNFARGKYRIKGYGRVRITNELKARNVSAYCIKKAMQEIEEEGGYDETLQRHIDKFLDLRKERYEVPLLRKKAFAHGVNKGFEIPLILNAIDAYFLES